MVASKQNSSVHGLDPLVLARNVLAGMPFDHLSFDRLFDPMACHYGVLQVEADYHQRGCATNCKHRQVRYASIDHLVWSPSGPFQRHVFWVTEV
jgi:hypothetical protein